MSPCTKQGPKRHGLLKLLCKNWSSLHRALPSIPLFTLGINRNEDCKPGKLPDIRVPVNEWAQMPTIMFRTLVEIFSRSVKAFTAANGEPILVKTQQEDKGVIVRCPLTFGYIVIH